MADSSTFMENGIHIAKRLDIPLSHITMPSMVRWGDEVEETHPFLVVSPNRGQEIRGLAEAGRVMLYGIGCHRWWARHVEVWPGASAPKKVMDIRKSARCCKS